MSTDILTLKGIRKSFFGTEVLHGIDVSIRKGTVHGLVGENGAGKSTLMNVLGGVFRPDEGEMLVDGKPYAPQSPKDAQKAHIAFVHQELNLFSNLTVAENLFIEDLPLGAFQQVKYKQMEQETVRYLKDFQIDVNPKTKVENLSMGVRQSIEIAKALIINADVVIFDEPTTSLTKVEKDQLFRIIADLKARNVTIIYISHILEDVFELCDDISVLRDGSLITTMPAGETNRDALISLMGSGRTELMRALFGLDKISGGEIIYKGKNFTHHTPKQAIEAGIAFVTEDRRDEGLLMPKPVEENLLLVHLPALAGKTGVVDQRKGEEMADASIKALHTKVQNKKTQLVCNLSGGNQQKVVLGKWIMHEPEVLILDEPTRGVDVGAKYEIYTIIQERAKEQSSVLVVSSEMEELMGICDRIVVMSAGRMAGEIECSEFEQNSIMEMALAGGGKA